MPFEKGNILCKFTKKSSVMKLNIGYTLTIIAFFMVNVGAFAQQQPEQPDVYEQAEMEADRLQRLLDLEDWQVFYVDSTLKHDIPAMMAEYDKLRESKVNNSAMYYAVQDKWMEKIDESYRKIFNDDQWKAYLKTGAGKAQKLRAKRKAKAEGKK
jgi:hypothetical protein